MNSEKAYDKIEQEAIWDVLKVYGVEGRLLYKVKKFYRYSDVQLATNLTRDILSYTPRQGDIWHLFFHGNSHWLKEGMRR